MNVDLDELKSRVCAVPVGVMRSLIALILVTLSLVCGEAGSSPSPTAGKMSCERFAGVQRINEMSSVVGVVSVLSDFVGAVVEPVSSLLRHTLATHATHIACDSR